MGLTFEKVWAALMETRERVDRTTENVNRMSERVDRTTENVNRMSERVDRTSEHVDKVTERFDKQTAKFDKLSENVGGLNRSLGELIETLIAARLWEKFSEYPYDLQRAYQRVPLFNENNRVLTDIDILLSNGDYVMAVEVKHELNRKDDVDHHLKRMELIRKYPPAETKGKKLLGAMAGGVVDSDIRDYAHNVGFFVLELAGESVKLVELPPGFTPREW
jgi:hypothetical protein